MGKKRRKLVPYAPPCPACGAGMQSVGSSVFSGWRCPEHGTMNDPAPEPVCETRPCSFGRAYVLAYLALVDERPEVIASGLPFFLAWEWDGMARMTPAERRVRWDRACRATIAERADRERDPKRRIDRGTTPAPSESTLAF